MKLLDIHLTRIQIEPTNRCNARCVICRRTHWNREIGDLSLENFKKILDKLPKTERLHLQGQGEPLLNADLDIMARLARQSGMSVGLSTNASLLNKSKATKLFAAGINRLNFSIDTLDPELFQKTRPGPQLDRILQNIEVTVLERERQGIADLHLSVTVVGKPSTIHSLPDVVNWAASLKMDSVLLQNVNYDFQYDRTINDRILEMDIPKYNEYTAIAQRIAEKKGLKLLLPSLTSGEKIQCGWPYQGCNITWDGYITLCCLQPDPDIYRFGNIFQEGFEEIWNNKLYRQFRKSFAKGTAVLCSKCPALYGNMWHHSETPVRNQN
jgi:MoaA/NifB/PqqE/SkfB family radical SAM enzyme